MSVIHQKTPCDPISSILAKCLKWDTFAKPAPKFKHSPSTPYANIQIIAGPSNTTSGRRGRAVTKAVSYKQRNRQTYARRFSQIYNFARVLLGVPRTFGHNYSSSLTSNNETAFTHLWSRIFKNYVKKRPG